MARRLIFLLGGARSGKSSYAERWARQEGGAVLFVATAEASDDDMRARIERHRASRPAAWHTLEAPRATARHIARCPAPRNTVIVDCLTLLTSHILLDLPAGATPAEANAAALRAADELLALQAQSQGSWLLVSNEVGMGLHPPTRLGGLFRDMLGRVNQRVAQGADEVLLLVAGIPWRLK